MALPSTLPSPQPGEWQAERRTPKIPWRKLWSQNHRPTGGHCTEGSDWDPDRP